MASLLVSVLIRCKNEEQDIGACLQSVFSQKYPSFEVVVVDSGSTDGTLAIIKNFPARHYHIPPELFTFGYSLNYGIERCRGEYIAILSSHALPSSDLWLGEIVDPLKKNTHLAGTMGPELPKADCNIYDKHFLSEHYRDAPLKVPVTPFMHFGNANSCIRRSVWERIGFDEALSGAEDWSWQLKVEKLGFSFEFAKNASVYHSHNETFCGIAKRTRINYFAVDKYQKRSYLWFFGSFFYHLYMDMWLWFRESKSLSDFRYGIMRNCAALFGKIAYRLFDTKS